MAALDPEQEHPLLEQLHCDGDGEEADEELLRELAARCLCADPEGRPSAEEVAIALEKYDPG